MREHLLNVAHVMWENGQRQLREASEILAVGQRGIKPREFEENELHELMVFKFENNISHSPQQHLGPNPKSLRLFLGTHKALPLHDRIVFLFVSLNTVSLVKYLLLSIFLQAQR
jgi:hypothetical protein